MQAASPVLVISSCREEERAPLEESNSHFPVIEFSYGFSVILRMICILSFPVEYPTAIDWVVNSAGISGRFALNKQYQC